MIRYTTVHRRLRRERGAAAGHPCSRCDSQASEWAYVGGAPDEVVEMRRPFGGPPTPVPYSCNTAYYIPLCTSCHRRHDGPPRTYSQATTVDLVKPTERTGWRQCCNTCEMVKDLGAFSVDRAREIGRQAKCRACNARYQVERKAQRRVADQAKRIQGDVA